MIIRTDFFVALLLIVFTFVINALDLSLELVTLMLIMCMMSFVVITTSSWSLVYFGVAVNLFFIWVALILTEGRISYLSADDYIEYYKKTIHLEALFWILYVHFHQYFSYRQKVRIDSKRNTLMRHASPHVLIVVALCLLSFEVLISSESYFSSYVDVSDVGTISYELGCLLLALAVVLRGELTERFHFSIVEMCAVLVAIYIVIGSGKRLPFAYVIISYLLSYFRSYGKLRATFIYLSIFVGGYIFGIVRDLLKIDGFDMAMLADGLGSTNQGAVLHASSVYIRIVDEGLISYMDRLVSFMGNVFGSLLFPISYLPEQVQVNVFSMQHYPVQGNGGFIGSYCYYFLGYPGVFILSALLAKLCTSRGYWIELVAMMILLTSPRWTLYNVGPVVRLISMALIIMFVLQMLTKMRLGKSSFEK